MSFGTGVVALTKSAIWRAPTAALLTLTDRSSRMFLGLGGHRALLRELLGEGGIAEALTWWNEEAAGTG